MVGTLRDYWFRLCADDIKFASAELGKAYGIIKRSTKKASTLLENDTFIQSVRISTFYCFLANIPVVVGLFLCSPAEIQKRQATCPR
jgi:hypothetical protein